MRENEIDLNEKKEKKQEKKRNKKPKNQEMLYVAYVFLGIFVCMIGYFVYFQTVVSSNVITSPYNKRQDTFADRVIRGEIRSSDGQVLAYTNVAPDGTETRVYPQDDLFSHAVGYASHGKTGIELLANYQLLSSHAYFLERFVNEVQEQKNIGDNVITTLNYHLQKTAYDALGDYRGTVIALEPSTGKVLAMVSKPDYNLNEIDANWKLISNSSDSVLLNRATQGLYPPGSIFKIVTLLEYAREGNDLENWTYECDGTYEEDGVTINCYHGKSHGTVDLKTAFAKSCNGAFAKMGMEIDNIEFMHTCNKLLFNTDLPLDIPFKQSTVILDEDSQTGTVMQTAIGQATTEVTPMHMAMIAAAIANGGNLMEPYFIESIENYTREQVKKYMPSSYGKLLEAEEAAFLTEYMEETVLAGTASKLKDAPYTAAGKTGTAEYTKDNSKSHAWFVGFSNVESPDLVVCVVVEGAGAGSDYAVPIAKKMFDAYYAQPSINN